MSENKSQVQLFFGHTIIVHGKPGVIFTVGGMNRGWKLFIPGFCNDIFHLCYVLFSIRHAGLVYPDRVRFNCCTTDLTPSELDPFKLYIVFYILIMS